MKTTTAKKSKLQEFSVAAQAEEITRQKVIELAKVNVEAAVTIKVEAGKAALSAKLSFTSTMLTNIQKSESESTSCGFCKPDRSMNFKWHASITTLTKYSHHQHSLSQLGQVQQLPHHLHQHRVLST